MIILGKKKSVQLGNYMGNIITKALKQVVTKYSFVNLPHSSYSTVGALLSVHTFYHVN